MTEPGPAADRDAVLDLLVAVARRAAAMERVGAARSDAPSTDVGGELAGDAGLATVVHAVTLVMDAAAASIALHDRARDRLVFVVAAGPAAGDVVGLDIDPQAGIAGYAFSTGQPLAVADVQADPRFDRTVAEATGYVPRSLLATPLYDDAGTLGVLEVLDRHGGSFDLRDLEVAAALAATAAAVVREGRARADTRAVLRGALAGLFSAEPTAVPAPALDDIVAAAVERAIGDGEDATWRLADRLGRLAAGDQGRIELAIEWVDALLRTEGRRAGIGRR